MTSMLKYFKHQASKNMHPGAAEKLLKKILPQMCVDNDICPNCSADLKPHDEFHSPYMHTKDRVCTQCDTVYKGGNVAIYRRHTESETSFQEGPFAKRAEEGRS